MKSRVYLYSWVFKGMTALVGADQVSFRRTYKRSTVVTFQGMLSLPWARRKVWEARTGLRELSKLQGYWHKGEGWPGPQNAGSRGAWQTGSELA